MADRPPASADTDRIGPTAHYTAYIWHRLGLPYAEYFATRRGAALYWGLLALGEWVTRLLPAVPSMRQHLEARHRLIDAVVLRLRPGCVVEIGAGLTPRAVAWAADKGVPGIELDLPGMAAAKRRRLARLPAGLQKRLEGRHEVRALDVLAPGFGERLTARLSRYRRPVVVAEGLLSYFDAPARRQVLCGVVQALRAVGGGTMVCSLHTAAAQARVGRAAQVLRAAQRGITRRRMPAPYADLDAIERVFEAAGFDHCHEAHGPDYADLEPRLARLRSVVHVIVGRVEPRG
ncbi:MAG: class I SAM-dependent methyltransferase [Myxococcota bacterium]